MDPVRRERGVGGRGFAPLKLSKPMVYLSWSPLPDHPEQHYSRGIELHWSRQPLACRPWLAGMKHLNCLEYVMASMELAAYLVISASRTFINRILSRFLESSHPLREQFFISCSVAGLRDLLGRNQAGATSLEDSR